MSNTGTGENACEFIYGSGELRRFCPIKSKSHSALSADWLLYQYWVTHWLRASPVMYFIERKDPNNKYQRYQLETYF